MHPLIPHLLGREVHSFLLFGGQLGISLGQVSEGILAQLVCPLGVPLCGWGIRQKLTRQAEQGALHLIGLGLVASVLELVAELPGLGTEPEGAGLAT